MASVSRKGKTGSVLMEFIIVFPIYLVLLAGLTMMGDMADHAIRLASADRTVAFDVQNEQANGLSMTREIPFGRTNVVIRGIEQFGLKNLHEVAEDYSDQNTLVLATNSAWYADTAVDYPWCFRAAATVRNLYKLPLGGTAGQLAAADHMLYVGTKDSGGKLMADEDPGFFGNLVSIRSVPMYAKSWDEFRRDASGSGSLYRYFGYYTLRRKRYWTDKKNRNATFVTWRSVRRYPSDLVVMSRLGDQAWKKEVAEEFSHGKVNDYDTNRQTFATPPGTSLAEYVRYPQFVTWSE